MLRKLNDSTILPYLRMIINVNPLKNFLTNLSVSLYVYYVRELRMTVLKNHFDEKCAIKVEVNLTANLILRSPKVCEDPEIFYDCL